ncbi:hypothetical protein FB45DRAFT_1065821 [Roridomyces roridus]|uniref:Uncharacterized protein n=1 Tax=Roridomyces roridus TaxID=1738132 RepID=A0AAD7FCG3_9AGAR|nr:hypothetical protein FB45DRAFT_1065821 [Roridomyces roridus]
MDKLRSLTWICSAEFALNADNVPVSGLSKLTDLRILGADASFLDLLARMELPALQKVTSAQFNPGFWSFLRSHGSKLVELDLVNFSAEDLEIPILEVCPNIRVLYLYSQLDQCEVAMLQIEHFLTGSATANSLEKLILRMCTWEKNEDNRWATFFSTFESTQFPQLNEIQSLACRWPKKERDIPKSKWVRWSEILLEQGINLTDATRKKWRPRLK